MVLFSLFNIAYFRLSNERWINSQFERFYCMSSKWDVAAETTRNINQAFGQGTVNERTAQQKTNSGA
jgi:hypothetical protein